MTTTTTTSPVYGIRAFQRLIRSKMISQRQSKEQYLEYLLGNMMDLGVPRSHGSGCQNLSEQSDINKGQDRAIARKQEEYRCQNFIWSTLAYLVTCYSSIFFHIHFSMGIVNNPLNSRRVSALPYTWKVSLIVLLCILGHLPKALLTACAVWLSMSCAMFTKTLLVESDRKPIHTCLDTRGNFLVNVTESFGVKLT